MTLNTRREVDNTRAKLKQLEQRYAELQAQQTEAGKEKIREWTLRSLKKLMNQLTEELARFEARSR